MITFAVWHDGLEEGQGRWVLAVEKNDLLMSNNEGELYWRPMADCKLIKAQTPDNPIAVIPIQPQQQQIVVPGAAFGRN